MIAGAKDYKTPDKVEKKYLNYLKKKQIVKFWDTKKIFLKF